jgi:hypothetical protein
MQAVFQASGFTNSFVYVGYVAHQMLRGITGDRYWDIGSRNRTPHHLWRCSVCSFEMRVIASASLDYREAFRKRSAFAITETELKLIAALASMGLSNHPNTG